MSSFVEPSGSGFHRPSTLEALRNRYEHNNGRGGGDGGGDKDEVEVLTKQLSSQMEYNNLLLEHLQVGTL